MSCWVVPSVAAELWGCTVDAVMSAIQNGHLTTREEAGWTFVDVAPHSPTIETPKQMRSATYTEVISAAEMEALTLPMNQESEETGNNSGEEMFDYRNARRTISTTRRAPLAKAA